MKAGLQGAATCIASGRSLSPACSSLPEPFPPAPPQREPARPWPRFLVTGHGPASTDAAADIALTRDYLHYLREEMGRAIDDFISFDEAYARTDWSRFSALPAFEAANRRDAYNTFLLMENESPAQERGRCGTIPADEA